MESISPGGRPAGNPAGKQRDNPATRQAAEAAAGGLEHVPPGTPGTHGRPVAAELRIFTWKVLIAAGIFGLLFLVWQVADALLLVFAGVLFAILMQRAADGLKRFTPLSQGWSLAVVLFVLAAALLGGGFLMGHSVASQFDQLTTQINRGIDQLPAPVRDQLAQQGRRASCSSWGTWWWWSSLRSISPPRRRSTGAASSCWCRRAATTGPTRFWT